VERYDASFFFLIFLIHIVFLFFIAVNAGQFEWLDAYHLELRSALIAGDHVAFLYLVYFKIQIVLALRAAGHGSLLSFLG
jgi:hypothetical protein